MIRCRRLLGRFAIMPQYFFEAIIPHGIICAEFLFSKEFIVMSNTKKRPNLRAMIECAIMVALATVLSMIKLYEAPLGGSVTLLSMLPICVLSIRLGLHWGLAGGFLYAMIQLFLDLGKVISWGLTPAALIGCLFFDYIAAFTVIGLAGLFRTRGRIGMIVGIALALFGRFCSHLVSGTLIFDVWMPDGWGSPFVYSVAYNGAYMLPELIFTVAAVILLTKTPAFRRVLEKK